MRMKTKTTCSRVLKEVHAQDDSPAYRSMSSLAKEKGT